MAKAPTKLQLKKFNVFRSTLTGDLAISGVTPDPSGKPIVELQLPKTLTPDHAYQLRLQFNGTTDALDQNPNGWVTSVQDMKYP